MNPLRAIPAVYSLLPSVLLSGLMAWGSGSQVMAQEKTAAELLPVSTVAFAEISQPEKLLTTVLDHPLAKEAEKLPPYQEALKSPQYQHVKQVVGLVEDKLGVKWRPALETLTGGGIAVGFDLSTQGVLILSKSSDAKLAEKSRDTLVELGRAEASRQGRGDPIREEQIGGVTTHHAGEARVAVLGPWILVTNKEALLRIVIDNYHGKGESLKGEEQFQKALKTRQGNPTAWAYFDLRVLWLTGMLDAALNKKSDNPVLELLAGGVVGSLPGAPFVTASLEVEKSHIRLSTDLPCDTKAAAKKREFYFGPDGNGAAPALLSPHETLLSLSTYRDFFSMWRHAPDLFNEKVNASFAEAEGGLTTIFSGRNFRDDILGNLEPGMQLVVTRPKFEAGAITPAIKLPSGAIVVRMKKPEETARQFKITYQSVIGFLNVVGGMNGLDPLDQSTEKTANGLIVYSEYLAPAKLENKQEAPLHFNASPTVAFTGDKFILSSSKLLAMELVDLLQKNPEGAKEVNTALKIDGNVLGKVLADNKESLIAQNMLEKGHGQEAAEKEVGLVMKAASEIAGASLSLKHVEHGLRLTVELNLSHR